MTATGLELRSVVRILHEPFNAHDPRSVLDHVDDEYEQLMVPVGQTLQGKEGFVTSMQSWIDGFPDASTKMRSSVADGDTVVPEFYGRRTHTDVFQTPMGPLSATGRSVESPFCQITSFRNGKLYRDRMYFDVLTILGQIGVDPSAGSAR